MKDIFRLTLRPLPSLAFLLALVVLPGCSGDLFSGDEKPPLEGERISVLELQESLEPDDAELASQGLITPAPWKNDFWPQAGGYPNHSMQNLELTEGALAKVWETDVGEGTTKEHPLTAQPVIVDGKIFAVDTEAVLSAFNVTDGKRLWSTPVNNPKEEDPVIGGGIAYAGGALFVTNGYNELLSVNPSSGAINWRVNIPAPSRAAPTILDGRVFVTTLDNRLLALSAADGSSLWEYAGLSESAGLIGGASPGANRDIVVPVFSSGEISALRVENGSVAWSDNLSNIRRFGSLSSIADIKALPILDKGLVVSISFSGRIVAIDERTGSRVWQREISGSNTPWMAGNHIFLISSQNELVGLGRENGVIRFVTKLPRFEDEQDKSGPIQWVGPILAGGRLLMFSDNGLALEADPQNGQIMRQWETGQVVAVAPIIAGGTLYILGEDGRLSAWR